VAYRTSRFSGYSSRVKAVVVAKAASTKKLSPRHSKNKATS